MASGVRDRDLGMARFIAALDDLTQARRVTVGIHEDTGAASHPGPSNATIVEVAAFQEFGTIDDPPIAFVRGAVDDNDVQSWLSRAGERALRSAMYGTSDSGHVERAFARVGARLGREMKKRAPVDTGAVRNAIEARVDGESVPLEDASRGED